MECLLILVHLSSKLITRTIILKCKERVATDIPPNIQLSRPSLQLTPRMTSRPIKPSSRLKIISHSNSSSPPININLTPTIWIKVMHRQTHIPKTKHTLSSMEITVKATIPSQVFSRLLCQHRLSRATSLINKCHLILSTSNINLITPISNPVILKTKAKTLLPIKISTLRMGLLSSSSNPNLTKISQGIRNSISSRILKGLRLLEALSATLILRTIRASTQAILSSLNKIKIRLLQASPIKQGLLILQNSKTTHNFLNSWTNSKDSSNSHLTQALIHLSNPSLHTLNHLSILSSKCLINSTEAKPQSLNSNTSTSLQSNTLNSSLKIKFPKIFRDSIIFPHLTNCPSNKLSWLLLTLVLISLWI